MHTYDLLALWAIRLTLLGIAAGLYRAAWRMERSRSQVHHPASTVRYVHVTVIRPPFDWERLVGETT